MIWRSAIRSSPKKVVAYFLNLEASDALLVSNAAIGLLPLPGALQMSWEFQSFHPLVQCLSGLILSDNRTSDHHVLALNTPLRGFVLHLSHDGESRFVFDDIEAFLLAARRADGAGGGVGKTPSGSLTHCAGSGGSTRLHLLSTMVFDQRGHCSDPCPVARPPGVRVPHPSD